MKILYATSPLLIQTIAIAAAALMQGRLVAFPTETVYGLGAPLQDASLRALYKVKGRPSDKPLPVLIPNAAAAASLADGWSQYASRLADLFWPGPLTMVVSAASHVSPLITAGSGNVGLRVPDHPVALALLKAYAAPLAAPSANPSGELPPHTAAAVKDGFGVHGGAIAFVLDGGSSPLKVSSTVLDMTTNPPRILRRGALAQRAIEEALGISVL